MLKGYKFVNKLNSKLYQYTFNKKIPLISKGSFKYSTYISDIDYTAYVRFTDKFIDILINKIKELKNFKFIYLNAGIDRHFLLPWKIDPEWGCDFDLEKTIDWFNNFKQKKLIPDSDITLIDNILHKDKLVLSDLIDIQDMLDKYNTIKWFLPDIEKKTKIVNGNRYKLLEELQNKKNEGSVLNSIYIDNNNIVSVDIGLTDNNYKKPIYSRMYKYYTNNWYKILKGYKKIIHNDFKQEYTDTMKKFEYTNSLLGRAELLNTLTMYNIVNIQHILHVKSQLLRGLSNIHLTHNSNIHNIIDLLKKTLNNGAYPYIDYFLDKLSYKGKIKLYPRIRLTEISNIYTSRKTLTDRRKTGILCPFFKSDTDEYIDTIGIKLLFNSIKFRKCIYTIINKYNISDIYNIFKYSPVSRIFLEYDNKNKGFVKVRGSFRKSDHEFFSKYGKKVDYNECYIISQKHLKILQIYLIISL